MSADVNLLDDAEDVDMDGDDREGDDQDDEEMTRAGEENAPLDNSTDQESSQLLSRMPSAPRDDAAPSSTIVVEQEATMNSISTAGADNVVQRSSEDAQVDNIENGARSKNGVRQIAMETGDSSMAEGVPTQDPVSLPEAQPTHDDALPAETSASGVSPPELDGPSASLLPPSEASTHSEVKLSDVTVDAPALNVQEESAVPMELDVQQPLERPEDSSDALALPIPSSVPMPTQLTDEGGVAMMQVEEVSVAATMQVEAVSAVAVDDVDPDATIETNQPPANASEPNVSSSARIVSEDPAAVDEESSAPPMKRSRTPSPSPERIQEFKAHEAAAEEPMIVAGNLPSPSPQPDPPSIRSPPPAPSNAAEGAVRGSHVTDVQFGGGATGAAVGEVGIEPSAHEAAALVTGEVTMEGEADPGKSLGEGDPVGVNGQEEFGDQDVRRAGAAPPTTQGEDSIAEKTTE